MTEPAYGAETAALIHRVLARGVTRAVVFMRHSARTFHPDIHDLDNQLTERGRALASELGAALPAGLHLRGYASPPQRCVDTAELLLAGYSAVHGADQVGRTRVLDVLGPFYALDQIRMWMGMKAAGGLQTYVQQWCDGTVGSDILLDAPTAARVIVTVLTGRLDSAPVDGPSLDICVSHDISLHMVRDQLLQQGVDRGDVRFLDALVLYRDQGRLWLGSHLGEPVALPDPA
ncbi:MAG: histidine phosphatase family protein [Pseudomonadota bacterium]